MVYRYDNGEDVIQKAHNLIDALGHDIKIRVNLRKVVRFRSRIQNKPGQVQIIFHNVQVKIKVLRSKMSIKGFDEYKESMLKVVNHTPRDS